MLLGNHHDAWVFGAVDPNSGTAVLMELARAFDDLLSNSESVVAEGGGREGIGSRDGGDVRSGL